MTRRSLAAGGLAAEALATYAAPGRAQRGADAAAAAHRASPGGRPRPMPPVQSGTFRYDGGPANPVPLPPPEIVPPPAPGAAPMAVPPMPLRSEDRSVSLPGK